MTSASVYNAGTNVEILGKPIRLPFIILQIKPLFEKGDVDGTNLYTHCFAENRGRYSFKFRHLLFIIIHRFLNYSNPHWWNAMYLQFWYGWLNLVIITKNDYSNSKVHMISCYAYAWINAFRKYSIKKVLEIICGEKNTIVTITVVKRGKTCNNSASCNNLLIILTISGTICNGYILT